MSVPAIVECLLISLMVAAARSEPMLALPRPLPQARASVRCRKLVHRYFNRRLLPLISKRAETHHVRLAKARQVFLLLLGEKAGMRASVILWGIGVTSYNSTFGHLQFDKWPSAEAR